MSRLVRAGVGRDWHRLGKRTHFGWRASLEYADAGKLTGGMGSTAHTTAGLFLNVSWY
jgi:hypothetical protein